jgi:type IV pilus assembly protein PilA
MTNQVMALGNTTGISHRLCASAGAVPANVPAAAKYQSKPTDWMTGDMTTGWTCLKFSMDDPQYFQYSYTATDTAAGPFACLAKGDLDGDTTASTFSMAGSIGLDGAKKVAIVAPNIGEIKPDE